jgi:hypothetical protein
LGDICIIDYFVGLADEPTALVSDSCINSDELKTSTREIDMTTIWMKRLAAGAMLTAAPALFAIGAAGASNAATGSVDNGANMSQPAHHESFPHQNLGTDAPGSRSHHHHQWHHAE